ncbi:tail assembly protein [Phocoenobacter skyensis]|uniref:Phage-related protein, tail component n=1 Tax=Phocoenobacter skyensis TaxID=97481 RepID=A0A1H8A1Q6_9PAST|nr:tail assembly protein [Pasteurella skyensis]MDP8184417.1 tail assembly protein [Pasteurella skyensis]QLB22582.1 phage tail protein [Pasteurella skyensis]SEM63709.1 Phage-related protein, tail component [Pasteurella skyensis]
MVGVRFYGSLTRFGDKFELDVQDTAEALRALTSQIQGLKQAFQQGLFKVRIGSKYIDSRYLEKGLFQKLKKGQTVHFTPVLKGAKKQGLFQTIVGVVMIVVGVMTSWAGGSALVASGIGMMIGGVAQMLTKTPEMNTGDEAEKKKSTHFSNLSNMTAQGRPVPLAYGKIRTGSLVISQGVETFDEEVVVE